MEEKYLRLVYEFKKLDIEDKKSEISKNMLELLQLLYYTNKKIDNMESPLPVSSSYDDEDEFLDSIFTYIISIKEENAKLIDNINKMMN